MASATLAKAPDDAPAAPRSRRVPAEAPAGAQQSPRPLPLTPSQLDELIALKLREVCAGIADWKLPPTVTGVLGDVPTTRYGGGRIYKLPLRDPVAPAAVTFLNVRDAMLQQAFAAPGDLVRATGLVVPELFKGTVSFRLEVVALEHDVPVTVPRQREVASAADTLRRLALERRPFPSVGQPTVTLIHPAASMAQVAEDFAGTLSPTLAASLHRMPVSMHEPAAIAAALRQVRTDIVVLVRGGGEPASFAVFEDPAVLEALAACRAYRVLGLGYTANRTLAELVADHAASTPTAPGEHLGRGIAEAGQHAATNGRLQELHEALLQRDVELARERNRQPVHLEPLQPDEPERETDTPHRKRALIPGWVWAAVGAAAAWLALHVL